MYNLIRTPIKDQIQQDLEKKMVFLGGPRQVGKTTLAKSLLQTSKKSYFNWDDLEDRKRILQREWSDASKLIVLDEIHKFKNWRGLIKGFYDSLKEVHQFLITGSARLDYYRKGGDSLLGRYYYYRLHPFSLPEIGQKYELEHLLKFGGFPEPLIQGSVRELKRWHLQRRERIIYSDIRDLENVRDISNIQVLTEALQDRVGSPLSKKNLAEDILVDQKTVEKWLQILERVYYCYRISPYGPSKIRAVKKEQKLYLWDWSELESEGPRWENFVGSHLLKYCHFHEDVNGEKMELRFLRDTDKREIDFVVLKNKKPLFAVECKTGEKNLSPHIQYFADRTLIPHFYQVHKGTIQRQISSRISILPFETFCEKENLI